MGQRMLMREGKMGHRIEIQIAFEYIYIYISLFVLVTFYLREKRKRERLIIKSGEKKIRDGRKTNRIRDSRSRF